MYEQLKKYTSRGFRGNGLNRRSKRSRQSNNSKKTKVLVDWINWISYIFLCLAIFALFWSFSSFIQRFSDSSNRETWSEIDRIEFGTTTSDERIENVRTESKPDTRILEITTTESKNSTDIYRQDTSNTQRSDTETERFDIWVNTKYKRIVNLTGTDNKKPYNSVVYMNKETPWQILSCIHLVETNRAINFKGSSYAGAKGNMQFMPYTWKSYCPDLSIGNLEHDVECADRYLQANYKQKKNWYKTIWQYNHELEYAKFVLQCSAKLGYDTANPPY